MKCHIDLARATLFSLGYIRLEPRFPPQHFGLLLFFVSFPQLHLCHSKTKGFFRSYCQHVIARIHIDIVYICDDEVVVHSKWVGIFHFKHNFHLCVLFQTVHAGKWIHTKILTYQDPNGVERWALTLFMSLVFMLCLDWTRSVWIVKVMKTLASL